MAAWQGRRPRFERDWYELVAWRTFSCARFRYLVAARAELHGLCSESSRNQATRWRMCDHVACSTDALDKIMWAQGGAITVRPNTCSLVIEKVRDHYEAHGHDRTHGKSIFSVNVIAPFQVTVRYVLAWFDCIQWR